MDIEEAIATLSDANMRGASDEVKDRAEKFLRELDRVDGIEVDGIEICTVWGGHGYRNVMFTKLDGTTRQSVNLVVRKTYTDVDFYIPSPGHVTGTLKGSIRIFSDTKDRTICEYVLQLFNVHNGIV